MVMTGNRTLSQLAMSGIYRHLPVLALAPFFVAACSVAPGSSAAPYRNADPAGREILAEVFNGRTATFVVLDEHGDRWYRHDPSRARERYSPASTFKIPHTLIALESGAVVDRASLFAWDSTSAPRQPWWPESWGRDHTLESAFRHSAVWYYQEVARRVGENAMMAYLDRFEYGNRVLGGGIDRFWLSGDLRISAEEQVDFLRRFYHNDLGVAPASLATVKDFLLVDDGPGYRLSGKTGWAGFGDASSPQVGWFVGYLERDGAPYFFALNLDIEGAEDVRARIPLVREALRRLGLMDSEPGSG